MPLICHGNDEKKYPVECIFQGCKVFAKGGPYKDLILGDPLHAKKDPRLKNSGDLKEFHFRGEVWGLSPATSFYDFVYIRSLLTHPDLCEQISEYDIFTDIEFNPKKSINCQARSAAIFVTLKQLNQLDRLASREKFLGVYARSYVDAQERLAI